METTDDKSQNPHERLSATLNRLRQLDRQIDTLPPTSRPVPTPPPPPGVLRNTRFFNREAEKARLEGEKEGLKADTWERIEKKTRGATDPSARSFKEYAREALYPNPFKTMSQAERLAERGTPKDIERAQDHMDVLRSEGGGHKSTPSPQTSEPAKNAPVGASLVERYETKSLRLDRFIKEGVDLVKDKADIDPKRD